MKMVNAGYGLTIQFREDQAAVLVVERPSLLSDITVQLLAQMDGEAGDFLISEEGREIRFSKSVALVMNPFQIDFNDRRTINKLYSELKTSAEAGLVDRMSINTLAIEAMDRILTTTSYRGIVHNLDFDWDKLFHMYEVRIEDQFDSTAEKICEYIKIMRDLFEIRLMVFFNLHTYLEPEELEYVYKLAAYYKIQLLLIEGREYPMISNEHTYIIDSDCCVIEREYRDDML